VDDDNNVLDGVTAAILDGTPIDWDSVESTIDPDSVEVLRQLKTVALLANLHRVAAATPDSRPMGPWMDLVRARTLEELLADGRKFAPADVIRIGAQLAATLAEAHAAGPLHHEVNAKNVMLADDGRAVLMDFGAPQSGSGSASNDLQNLGVLLQRLLATSPRSPQALADLVARLRDPDPARRFASARELEAELTALGKSMGSSWTRWFSGHWVLLALVLLAPGRDLSGAPAQATPFQSNLAWRNIGPAVTGTRIVDFAVVERDPRVIYAATASSGLWKTTNAGTTWAPVFEKEGTVSLGGVAVSQSHPDVVWVATGEPNMRNLRSTSRGNGVYKSIDAGRTWKHAGLADSPHMGRIVIHPTNPDIVFASVIGSMWHTDARKDEPRGLWKTADGGATWRKVLDAGQRAGIVDVALDPARPNTVYAAAWHRERRDWSFVNAGAEGGIHKSTDGGLTWTKLVRGLPEGPVGRIGLSVCRSRPATIYAAVEGQDAGVFRSLDGGVTWTRRNPMAAASMYYGQIRCDPTDPDRVHVLQTEILTSNDGGMNFSTGLVSRGVHVDHHALWINPQDRDHLLLGNDGGIYQSRDRGATWAFHGQMATTQFYAIGVDMREPFYYVCGGTQDNNSLCGPSATRHTDGIVSDDWYVTTGGDGFSFAIRPDDPSVVYTEAQYGALVRFNPFTGERRNIRPTPPQGTAYRWNWNAPIRLSPHDPDILYFGSQFLHRSKDKGATWETISPDLTRQVTIEPRYRISDYGTLLWIHESPRRPGLIAVGTDDGLIQITDDGGITWTRAAPLPGVPERAQIRRVLFSAHADRTMYVAAAAHEDDDYAPYVLRSTDLGRTWTSIVTDLPPGVPVFALAEDPVRPGLLFAGTELGVHASLNDGGNWMSLKLNLPTVAVHDIVIHPRERDLIIGTHGRGIWILDSIRGLEGLTSEVAARDGALFAPRAAVLMPRFDRGRSNLGQAYYTAPNPPDGVLIDFYVNPRATGPVTLEVFDAAGTRVRVIDVGPRDQVAGLRRAVWDLRRDPPPAPGTEAGRGQAPGRPGGAGAGGEQAGAGQGRGGRGAAAPAGKYEARLTVGAEVYRTELVIRAGT
jgi:photosystem II stability/assembly factor-like uncharacterized protein